MLILTVRKNEKVIVGAGNNQVEVQIIKQLDGSFDIGFTAPRHIPIDVENVRKSKMHGIHEMTSHVPK